MDVVVVLCKEFLPSHLAAGEIALCPEVLEGSMVGEDDEFGA